MATALSLGKSWLLRNLRHSTNVSVLKYILELALSHPPLCLRGLPTHAERRAICYKLRSVHTLNTDCYDFTGCEIITKFKRLLSVALSL